MIVDSAWTALFPAIFPQSNLHHFVCSLNLIMCKHSTDKKAIFTGHFFALQFCFGSRVVVLIKNKKRPAKWRGLVLTGLTEWHTWPSFTPGPTCQGKKTRVFCPRELPKLHQIPLTCLLIIPPCAIAIPTDKSLSQKRAPATLLELYIAGKGKKGCPDKKRQILLLLCGGWLNPVYMV